MNVKFLKETVVHEIELDKNRQYPFFDSLSPKITNGAAAKNAVCCTVR
jgi:hypothetical protein